MDRTDRIDYVTDGDSADVMINFIVVIATVSVKNENEYTSSQNTLIDHNYTP